VIGCSSGDAPPGGRYVPPSEAPWGGGKTNRRSRIHEWTVRIKSIIPVWSSVSVPLDLDRTFQWLG
jgi:hypothetical protein